MVFRYDLEYMLSEELTGEVSDHYPIQTCIQGNTQTSVQRTQFGILKP